MQNKRNRPPGAGPVQACCSAPLLQAADEGVLVLGLGNRLLGDDAVGPVVVEQMAGLHPQARWLDGGTIGLALLPTIESCRALVVVDAARLGLPPGDVRVIEGAAMDAQLGGLRHSAHEVALGDLMAAAALAGCLPARRALVAVQPQSLALGDGLSPAVLEALPRLREAVIDLLHRWSAAEPAACAAAARAEEEETVHD